MSRLVLVTKAEEVPFAPDNQDWVRNEIQSAIRIAIAPLKPPSGWRKALFILREWGVLAVTATIILTLGGLLLTQWNAANKRLADEARFEEKTGDHLSKIDESLRVLTVSNTGATPNNPDSQSQAKNLIAEARKNSAKPLPKPVVQRVGAQFVDASATDQNAWNVALDFVSYRSSQNHPRSLDDFVPFGTPSLEIGPPTHFSVRPLPGVPSPRLAPSKARVAIDVSARLELMGAPLKQTSPDGPEAVLVAGGGVSLDDMYARQVVFHEGGPLRLNDVTFVNCTFVLKNDLKARALALAVLSKPSVDLQPKRY